MRNLTGVLGPIAVVAFLLSGSALFAQVDTGTILGTITDSSGGIVPGARVTITNEGTQQNW